MKNLLLIIATCFTLSLQSTQLSFIVLYKLKTSKAAKLCQIALDDQKNVTDLLAEINNNIPQNLNPYTITTCTLWTPTLKSMNTTDLLDTKLQNVVISKLPQTTNKIFVNY